MTSKKLGWVALVAVFGLVGLTWTASSNASSKTKREVTFSKDVAPIIYKECAQCHKDKDIAPMSLMSYKEARPWARSIKEKVLTREMPPWSPDPKYGEFRNAHRLTQEQIDTIVAWVDQGAKEGNPKDLPPLPAHAQGGWDLGEPDVVFELPQEYVVEPNAPDNYIYFTVPTNFKEDKWVQSAEIIPGNRKVVHHVICFVQTPEGFKKAREADGRRRRGGREASFFYRDGTLSRVKPDAPVVDDGCNMPPELARRGQDSMSEGGDAFGSLLAGYAPGKAVDRWLPGTAKLVPAGSVIIFQMHYSAFRGELTAPEKDRTKIGLRFAKEPPERAIVTLGVSNGLFKIPAGAEAHKVTACYTFTRDVELASYMPHMHLRGKDMKYELVTPEGKKETILWVPKFNFNWQEIYFLAKPLKVRKGSKLIVTAHFDNSKKNKYNPDPTKDVRWGDPTYDEMMIGWLDYTVPVPEKDVAKGAGR